MAEKETPRASQAAASHRTQNMAYRENGENPHGKNVEEEKQVKLYEPARKDPKLGWAFVTNNTSLGHDLGPSISALKYWG